jgi:hypothetical protein
MASDHATGAPAADPASRPDDRLRREIVLLAAFLLTGADGLLNEPPEYGAFRCADAARRALAILADEGTLDPRLESIRARLDEIAFAPMGDLDLSAVLEALCLDMAAALRNPA